MAAAVPAFLSGIIGLIGFAQKAALANKQAKLQEEDAARQQVEYNLRAQDFTLEGRIRESTQGRAYSRSGVVLAGSALRRLNQTRSRTNEGARRLRETGTYAVERGDRLADITRSSVGSPFAAFFGPFLSAFGQAGGYDQAAGFFGGLGGGQQGIGGGGYSLPRLPSLGGSGAGRGLSFTY